MTPVNSYWLMGAARKLLAHPITHRMSATTTQLNGTQTETETMSPTPSIETASQERQPARAKSTWPHVTDEATRVRVHRLWSEIQPWIEDYVEEKDQAYVIREGLRQIMRACTLKEQDTRTEILPILREIAADSAYMRNRLVEMRQDFDDKRIYDRLIKFLDDMEEPLENQYVRVNGWLAGESEARKQRREQRISEGMLSGDLKRALDGAREDSEILNWDSARKRACPAANGFKQEQEISLS